jgi:hypothetical protein
MATPLYHVYISRASTTPTAGGWDTSNEGDYTNAAGWIHFTCQEISDSVKVNNTLKHMIGHASYSLRVGKLVQSMVFQDCVMEETDASSASSSAYNDVKEFLLRSACTGANCGYDIYMSVYAVDGTDTYYIKWINNSETMVDVCHVVYMGHQITATHDGIYRGNIMFTEVWD